MQKIKRSEAKKDEVKKKNKKVDDYQAKNSVTYLDN